MAIAPLPFDPATFFDARPAGHGRALGIRYAAHGDDWCELTLPYAEALIGDPARGVIASGPIVALLDMATSVAVWMKRGGFLPHATLDLRVDYLRPAGPGRAVTGRGECYRVTRSIAFVRGIAHDGDAADPVAHVAGTFMFTDAPA
ncbi:PaaI family thioesterase [Sphingomonas sp. BT-65]|uniref:PaaI family thioesterase n=1 Tax=Sphingomonas sp. BT-65 TaxID=2989821 RepID=UPI0022356D2D|nr:PaaI family thioesterase [Sphingomonas sp. BT-65]MCW4462444.1 PaaI family thioesterase [Sphingomonas sp. BT-65]